MSCTTEAAKYNQNGKCDEECLRRIAARLCRLNDCDDSRTHCGATSNNITADAQAASLDVNTKDACCCGDESSQYCDQAVADGSEKKSCSAKEKTTVVDEETASCNAGDRKDGKVNDCSQVGDAKSVSAAVAERNNANCCSSELERNSPIASRADTCCMNKFCAGTAESCHAAKNEVEDRENPCAESAILTEYVEDCCGSSAAKTGCCSSKSSEAEDCCNSEVNKTGCSSKPSKAYGCGASTKRCGGGAKELTVCSTPSMESYKVVSRSTYDDQGCNDETEHHDEKTFTDECIDNCCKLLSTRDMTEPASACECHLQTAFRRFEALLANGRCLCRSVLDQIGFCCCTLGPDGMPAVSKACNAHRALSDKTGAAIPAVKAFNEIDTHSRCAYDAATVTKPGNFPGANDKRTSDLEHAAARERVVLNVSGMTCTGCSRKMMNVMGHIPAISNAQVTFVSGMADFDFDTSTDSLENVLSRLEKETGFKCQRISIGYQTLHVLMSAASAKSLLDQDISGIVSITSEKKKAYRITYDPRAIGARSIINDEMSLAPPIEDVGVIESKRRLWNMLASFIAAAVLTIPVVVLNWADISVSYLTKMIISLCLATCVQLIAIPEFYIGAVKSLIYSHVIEMDMLVVISITAAYVYSIVAFALMEAGYNLVEEAFFETSTLLITLVLLGRLMAAWARMRAISAVSLPSLQAQTALLLDENGSGNSSQIDARHLQFGDEFKILPHSRIVTDGTIVFGDSAVDESMLTGESAPVAKRVGDAVIGGTVNGSGLLHVRLTRLPGENSITDIAQLVENAVSAKPRVQDLADKFSSWFVPAVIAIALCVFVIWVAVGIEVRDMQGGGAVGIAITYAIVVLAISCPCALGLAVPMVLVIAGGLAARSGVIIKAADATERSCKVTDVVFDKTGTLTKGDLQVVHDEAFGRHIGTGTSEALALTKALVNGNEHPVSVAVASYLAERSMLDAVEIQDLHSIPGAGIEAQWNDHTVMAGNPYWLGVESNPRIAQLLSQGMTYFCISVDNELALVFGLKSTLRAEASTTITNLQHRRITCHIVSGDGTKVVEDVARTLGIDLEHTISRSSPAGKQEYISRLQESGKTVLFCGDGTNDAVAVAQANVGLQIGSASDVTATVADVVLLGGLEGVITLLEISRRSLNRIRFNFV